MQETCRGWFIQYLLDFKPIEDVTHQEITNAMHWVTSKYTFETPLRFALTAVGMMHKKQIEYCEQVANHLGHVFQLTDDILGVFGDKKKTGKSSHLDIEQGKKNLIIALYLSARFKA